MSVVKLFCVPKPIGNTISYTTLKPDSNIFWEKGKQSLVSFQKCCATDSTPPVQQTIILI